MITNENVRTTFGQFKLDNDRPAKFGKFNKDLWKLERHNYTIDKDGQKVDGETKVLLFICGAANAVCSMFAKMLELKDVQDDDSVVFSNGFKMCEIFNGYRGIVFTISNVSLHNNA